MASAFGHALLGATLGKLLLPARPNWPWWLLAAACAVVPDADVVGFKFGVAYASLWGHRGLTHSILAAVVLASSLVLLARVLRPKNQPPAGRLWLLLFLATVSHGVLDAMTTGGLGVAFLSPFEQGRYFFGFRPIQVSPIGVKRFAGAAALRVLRSEAIWVGIPCLLLYLGQRVFGPSPVNTRS
ncbi:metal-dependent hydrolase [Hymenobacter chitinivorans]|uniref:Inner membrane protein n=1 Tax=Hymenobacter chitinivorans DSM 11115 TaxID=1121954 RepID=A0A2M9BPV4_9BACT|nr:metal-dependent hydrolase [Hymenobacter chitinivorans]PJJ59973.1 inner membrane protein [Hymenobacter chitinivorans DSM 11115]